MPFVDPALSTSMFSSLCNASQGRTRSWPSRCMSRRRRCWPSKRPLPRLSGWPQSQCELKMTRRATGGAGEDSHSGFGGHSLEVTIPLLWPCHGLSAWPLKVIRATGSVEMALLNRLADHSRPIRLLTASAPTPTWIHMCPSVHLSHSWRFKPANICHRWCDLPSQGGRSCLKFSWHQQAGRGQDLPPPGP